MDNKEPFTVLTLPPGGRVGVRPRRSGPPTAVEQQALDEIAAEDHAAAVAAAKVRLREKAARRRWWHGLIPFTIKIERRT